ETRKGDEKVRNISSKSDPDKYDEILRSKIDPKTPEKQRAKRAKKDLKTGKELTPEQTDLLIRAGVITKEKFATELKKAAVANDCYQIELLEKAWELDFGELEGKDKSFGKEINGKKRPAVVINDPKSRESKVMIDQIRSIDKQKLGEKCGELTAEQLAQIEQILNKFLDLTEKALAVEAQKKKFRKVSCQVFTSIKEIWSQAKNYDLIIIDGPARASQATYEIAQKADLVIQPVGASRADLRPAVKEFHALKEAGIPTKKLLFVVNRVASEAEAKAVYNHLKQAKYQIAEPPLYERASYRTEQNRGGTITTVSYKTLSQNARQLPLLNMEKLLKKIFRETESEIEEMVAVQAFEGQRLVFPEMFFVDKRNETSHAYDVNILEE
ncbi:45086_t:CDS:2, partial [Gigaspora margarita]